jgi:Ca-activated chloride channel family protein
MKFAGVLLLALALCAPGPARAQERGAPPDDGPADDSDVVKLDTTLVEVPAVVSEPGGRYVADLQASDFTVREDGVVQTVSFFAAVDEPISVALMLDCSNSTREKLDRIKEAASVFLDQLRPHDRVAVITFDDEVRVAAPLTNDRAQLRRAIEQIQVGQFTQVYEAVHTVAEDVLGYVEGRKAAIVFTDGIDTASSIATFDDTLAEIAYRQIIVYPIRYNTRPDVEARAGLVSAKTAIDTVSVSEQGTRPRRVVEEEMRREKALKALAQAYHVGDAYLWELADRSGGVLHKADTLADLPSALAKIAAELRHQYLLGFYPADPDRADAERRISVAVSRPGLVVRSRQSYRTKPRARR